MVSIILYKEYFILFSILSTAWYRISFSSRFPVHFPSYLPAGSRYKSITLFTLAHHLRCFWMCPFIDIIFSLSGQYSKKHTTPLQAYILLQIVLDRLRSDSFFVYNDFISFNSKLTLTVTSLDTKCTAKRYPLTRFFIFSLLKLFLLFNDSIIFNLIFWRIIFFLEFQCTKIEFLTLSS